MSAPIIHARNPLIITGPGRPDIPTTTDGTVTGSEPDACEYRSTDGAGVGAWVWAKRAGKWIVTDGDTGMRIIMPQPSVVEDSLGIGMRIVAGKAYLSIVPTSHDGFSLDKTIIKNGIGSISTPGFKVFNGRKTTQIFFDDEPAGYLLQKDSMLYLTVVKVTAWCSHISEWPLDMTKIVWPQTLPDTLV